MTIKYPHNILINGIISSCLFGFLISLFEGLSTGNVNVMMWYLIIPVILLMLRKSELDKLEDQDRLTEVEPVLLIASLLIGLLGLSGFLVTFSQYWLAMEIRYPSLALGLPSLLAILFWEYKKIAKQ